MSTTESSPQPDDLLLFAPVASAYRGANGWTAEVQRAFVDALARTGVVAAAARSVGRSRESAHRLRRRAGEDSGFARAWDQAQARAGRVALAHAVDGVGAPRRVEVWYRGRHVGWRTYYDNRVTLAALRALDRQETRWAAAGLDATKLLNGVLEFQDERDMCDPSRD